MRKRSFFVRIGAMVLGLGLGLVVQAPETQADEAAAIEAIVLQLAGADVIALGEIHDNPAHHQVQAQLIATLKPAAIVWEMVAPELAAELKLETLQDLDALEAYLQWDRSGWPEFEIYAPVFQAAENARHFGAWVPRGAVGAAMEAGIASYFGAEADRFGLTQPLDQEAQSQREADQLANHCNAMPVEMLPILVDIQRLRDAKLAQVAERAYFETGGPVVVITGNGHARKDHGLFVYLSKAQPRLDLRAFGQAEEGGIQGDFDVTLSSPGITRPDPCLAFSKQN
ncbi:hypothetical protein RSK20926_22134 [Roseobacter sp. SK209-2-6]|uniref:ChaN family lipoprotein n=1 Tax=Roseobacter sp. SK209-2-6 TaxID=388739 RepID=UPI0000F3F23A|nr:ChaN family lipoprotein [Roseobacter sp. SK209-2-6]EBA16470.1 hypothetical protein RSK20926_22134 [Roseobacter sp. SK209-2-6]